MPEPLYILYALLPLVLGTLSGWMSAGTKQRIKASRLQPPGWVFGLVWPILYLLMGIAFARVVATARSGSGALAIALFIAQLVLNVAWYPALTFAANIPLSQTLSWLLLVTATITAALFWNLDAVSGALMVPYIAWLCFATYLSMHFVYVIGQK